MIPSSITDRTGFMILESRTSLHFGVSFIFGPQPVIDSKHSLKFQMELANRGLEFATVSAAQQGKLLLGRPTPPLEVRLQQPAPPVGQLIMAAGRPARTLDDFTAECHEIVQAFSATWPGNLQIVQRDCTIRHLYDTAGSNHAFKYLWEDRLGESPNELKVFGRPVSAGGLRFVIQATQDAPQAQVRIESYIRNPRKLFVEVQMGWLPRTSVQTLDPEPMLTECEHFATHEVVDFLGRRGT